MRELIGIALAMLASVLTTYIGYDLLVLRDAAMFLWTVSGSTIGAILWLICTPEK